MIRIRKPFRNLLVALGLGVCLNGCAVADRAERFANAFTREFQKEYAIRSDPNIVSNDRYASLRKLGELQRQVSSHLITPFEARQRVDKEDYDRAFDAVQNIAKGALQDAFRQSNPEVRAVEQFTTFRVKNDSDEDLADLLIRPQLRLTTSVSDLFNPKVNLSSSFSGGKLNFVPALRLGRLYSISYSTKGEEFDHTLRYNYDRWSFRIDVEHTLRDLKRVGGNVAYAVSDSAVVNLNYNYTHANRDHVFSWGFSWGF